MTDDARMLCRRCGFANQGGDQFCGSCGAFLEWEGQADAAAGSTPVHGRAAGEARVEAPRAGAGEDLASLVRATAAPPVALTPPAAPSAAAVVRCPACGIANAAGRTFCQSCGATLATASRVATRSTESIAAAVASVPRAAPPTPAPASPAGGRAAAQGMAPRKSGFAGWLVVVVLLGILAGVGVVVVPTLLKGSGPASAATAEPSVAVSTGASVPASSGSSPSGVPASSRP